MPFNSCEDCYNLLGKEAKCSYEKKDGKIYAQCGENKIVCKSDNRSKYKDIELKYDEEKGVVIEYNGKEYVVAMSCKNNKLYPELGGCWFKKEYSYYESDNDVQTEKKGYSCSHLEFGDAVLNLIY